MRSLVLMVGLAVLLRYQILRCSRGRDVTVQPEEGQNLHSIGHFRVPFCLCFKLVSLRNHSYKKKKNDFDLYENETACRTHFHLKGLQLDSF